MAIHVTFGSIVGRIIEPTFTVKNGGTCNSLRVTELYLPDPGNFKEELLLLQGVTVTPYSNCNSSLKLPESGKYNSQRVIGTTISV